MRPDGTARDLHLLRRPDRARTPSSRKRRSCPGGGTLAVHLAVHALSRGYEAITWVCNVRHFDPTWFQQPTDLRAKLRARCEAKNIVNDPRYGPALEAVERYLELGGKFHWGDLTPELIAKTLGDGMPILTGTNGTYLYQCARETEAGPRRRARRRVRAFHRAQRLSLVRSVGRDRGPAARQSGPRHQVLSRDYLSPDRRHLSRRRLRRRQPARDPAEGLEEARPRGRNHERRTRAPRSVVLHVRARRQPDTERVRPSVPRCRRGASPRIAAGIPAR